MSRLVVALLVLGLVSHATSPLASQALPPETTKKIREHYVDAMTQFKSKEYAKSNAAYEQVLALLPAVKEDQLEPNRARIQYDMACNHALLGKKAEAIQSLERSVGHGYWDADMLKKDPSLKDLHAEKAFQAVAERARVSLGRMVVGLTDILTGKKLELKDLQGKVVIIDIWGTWCPPCRREVPYFVKLQQNYGNKGLQIVGLTYERQPSPEAARKGVEAFAKAERVNYPLVMLEGELQGLLASLYGLRSFPTTYFFGKDGSMKHRLEGLHEYDALEEKTLGLLAEKTPVTPISP